VDAHGALHPVDDASRIGSGWAWATNEDTRIGGELSEGVWGLRMLWHLRRAHERVLSLCMAERKHRSGRGSCVQIPGEEIRYGENAPVCTLNLLLPPHICR
jgi:hypothetical protein